MPIRPSSAKYLTPTIPETKGIVNRENLLAIAGRLMKPLILLAKKMQVSPVPKDMVQLI